MKEATQMTHDERHDVFEAYREIVSRANPARELLPEALFEGCTEAYMREKHAEVAAALASAHEEGKAAGVALWDAANPSGVQQRALLLDTIRKAAHEEGRKEGLKEGEAIARQAVDEPIGSDSDDFLNGFGLAAERIADAIAALGPQAEPTPADIQARITYAIDKATEDVRLALAPDPRDAENAALRERLARAMFVIEVFRNGGDYPAIKDAIDLMESDNRAALGSPAKSPT